MDNLGQDPIRLVTEENCCAPLEPTLGNGFLPVLFCDDVTHISSGRPRGVCVVGVRASLV
jgi:hypothetical protein